MSAYLDANRTAQLWERVKGVSVPAGGEDGQIVAKDGGEAYKTKWIDPPGAGVLTQEEFDALPEEKRNHGIYIVTTDGDPLAGLEIEEYDTTVDGCQWHVRKWSNGYIEMSGRKDYRDIPIDTFSGQFSYNSANYPIGLVTFPVPLIKKYSEIIDIDNYGGTSNARIAFIGKWPNTTVGGNATWDALTTSSRIRIYQVAPMDYNTTTYISDTLVIFVTGRWK